MADGIHTLTASVTDQAQNAGTASRTVIVDNTPPDTQITGGPVDTVGEPSATFTFAGTDNLTAAAGLAFAWRLDGGALHVVRRGHQRDAVRARRGIPRVRGEGA